MTTHLSRRPLVISVALLLVAATMGYALRPETIDVDSYTVSETPLRSTIDEDGRTRVKNRFVITAPVTGRLERVALREGDRVSRGEVVAWLSPVPLDSASRRAAKARLDAATGLLQEASARVTQATVALDLARNAEARKKKLFAAGAAPATEYEEAEAELRAKSQELVASRSRGRAAQAEVTSARAALASSEGHSGTRVPVRSPASGRVLRLPEPSERVVNAGVAILELGDARSIEVVADVLSADAVRVRTGDKVIIAEWGGDGPLPGRVTRIEPAAFTRVSALGVEEQRVNIVMDVIGAPESLGDGFRVEAQIVVWESKKTIAVPSSALFQRRGAWQVFIVENGRARRRPVSVGHSGATMVEITSGLGSGEHVILFPSDQIDEGVRVREHIQE